MKSTVNSQQSTGGRSTSRIAMRVQIAGGPMTERLGRGWSGWSPDGRAVAAAGANACRRLRRTLRRLGAHDGDVRERTQRASPASAGEGKLSGSIYRRGKNVPLTGKVEGGDDPVRGERQQDGRHKAVYAGSLCGRRSLGQGGGLPAPAPGATSPPTDWKRRGASRATRTAPPAPRTLDSGAGRVPSRSFLERHSARAHESGPATRCAPERWTRWRSGSSLRQRRACSGGNPQTGPFFFVEGAMPGDVLVVRIKRTAARENRGRRPSATHGLVDGH